MSDSPRPWPNFAKEQRDKASESAVEIILLLEPLTKEERQFTENERLRRVARALYLRQKIARLLESVGAQTRPF